jgi:hypothetical protein
MPSKKLAAKGPTTSVVPPDSQVMSGRFLSETCARTLSDHAAAELPNSVMNSRRFMPPPDRDRQNGSSLKVPLSTREVRGPSLDHLIGALLDGQGYVDTERLGRFEIDHQFVLGGRLHRKIGWLVAL